MKIFTNLNDFQLFCETHSEVKDLWEKLALAALKLLALEYDFALKIIDKYKVNKKFLEAISMAREAFNEQKENLKQKCDFLEVKMPDFDVDMIGAIIWRGLSRKNK